VPDVLLFDLDGTLYDLANPMVAEVDRRMTAFLQERLAVSWDEADRIRVDCTQEFGSLARGIVARYGLDPREFLATCLGGVNPAQYLPPDAALRATLQALPQSKAIFTNAPRPYTERVLGALGVGDQFERLLTIEWGDYRGKPAPELYRAAEAEVGASGGAVALVDDSPANLVPARALGWATVLVDRAGTASAPLASRRLETCATRATAITDHVIRDLAELTGIFGGG